MTSNYIVISSKYIVRCLCECLGNYKFKKLVVGAQDKEKGIKAEIIIPQKKTEEREKEQRVNETAKVH